MNVRNLKVGVIGCGNMGRAIIKGLIGENIVSRDSILVNDKCLKKAEEIASRYGCSEAGLAAIAERSDYLMIAVKPQDSDELLRELSGHITSQTVISIMAGVKIKAIIDIIGKDASVARAMPNMAAFFGESITGVSYNPFVEKKDEVRNIFSCIGDVVEVDEDLLDAVTAISGSGPAYFFYFAEAMIEAGVKAGLDKGISSRLVAQTLYGASIILREQEGLSLRELINAIASKGGTTEAALSVFEKRGQAKIVEEAVLAAKRRSEELSKG